MLVLLLLLLQFCNKFVLELDCVEFERCIELTILEDAVNEAVDAVDKEESA